MADNIDPDKGKTDEDSTFGMSRRQMLSLTLLGAVGANTAAAVNNALPTPVQREERKPKPPRVTTAAESVRAWDSLQHLIHSETYNNPDHTAGRFFGMVDIFKGIHLTEIGEEFIYYSIRGIELSRQKLPKKGDKLPWGEKVLENFPTQVLKNNNKAEYNRVKVDFWNGERVQRFQNHGRRQALPAEGHILPKYDNPTDRARAGYPLIYQPFILGAKDSDIESRTAKEIVEERLGTEHFDPRYFGRKKLTFRNAVEIIADGYDVPLFFALGVGAQESGFKLDEKSHAAAEGPYQFLESTAEMARPVANGRHVNFRKGTIKHFSHEKANPFVQAELFCAHYNQLKEQLAQNLKDLYEAIRTLSPDFNTSLEEVAILTAYNGGLGNCRIAINQFIAAPADKKRQLIGEPPHGLDVWMGIIGFSYRNPRDIGPDVFSYAYKVFAWGQLLLPGAIDKDDFGEDVDRDKIAEEIAIAKFENGLTFGDWAYRQAFGITKWAGTLLGVGTVVAATRAAKKDGDTSTRRSFIVRTAAGALAAWTTLARPSKGANKNTLDE